LLKPRTAVTSHLRLSDLIQVRPTRCDASMLLPTGHGWLLGTLARSLALAPTVSANEISSARCLAVAGHGLTRSALVLSRMASSGPVRLVLKHVRSRAQCLVLSRMASSGSVQLVLKSVKTVLS